LSDDAWLYAIVDACDTQTVCKIRTNTTFLRGMGYQAHASRNRIRRV
jgi:hypothetical protein